MSRTPVDLSPVESARVAKTVLAPLVAQGAIIRRPRATAWAERHQTDRSARAVLTELRTRYHGAPVVLRLGSRKLVIVTKPGDVRRLLEGSPDPFTPATAEKRGALAHFQPGGVLISSTPERQRLRPFNEEVLQPGRPVHDDASTFVRAVSRGADNLVAALDRTGRLDVEAFTEVWWSIVLEVAFGANARTDRELVESLNALRRDANWSWLRPQRTHRRHVLESRIAFYLRAPEPGSLAAATRAADPETAASQVPHWLFAADAAGAVTLRALAVAAARPAVRDRLRAELAAATETRSDLQSDRAPAVLSYARACVLESVRLWPTTFAVLRDSTAPTGWGRRTLPADTGFAVVSSFFHRDADRLDHADAFVPEAWLDGRNNADWSLVPFSAGPVSCPGRNLVLLLTSHLLARLAGEDLDVARGKYLADDPLPLTVDHLGLRFSRAGTSPSTS